MVPFRLHYWVWGLWNCKGSQAQISPGSGVWGSSLQHAVMGKAALEKPPSQVSPPRGSPCLAHGAGELIRTQASGQLGSYARLQQGRSE